ncbi:MAG: hypothetical protein LUC44_00750 [Prevotellaceae bacterium]|nr:hypothetical protein [Prevotellaceae bacterium]
MAAIQIDRNIRLTLLRWLKQGYIDRQELSQIESESDHKMTVGEMLKEIDECVKLYGYMQCRRCQKLGLCEIKAQAEGYPTDLDPLEIQIMEEEERENGYKNQKGGQ